MNAAAVIAIIGLPGAGKSVLARELERCLGLRRVCRDAIRSAMFPRCGFSYAEKRAAFRGVLYALEVNCLLGHGSVLDGMTLSRTAERETIIRLCASHQCPLVWLHLDCPIELARSRVRQDQLAQRHPARDRNAELVDEIHARFQPPPLDAVVLDAGQPPDAVARVALSVLRERFNLT